MDHPETAAAATVHVRLFAAAREAVGTAQLQVRGDTVAAVLAEVVTAAAPDRAERIRRVLAVCSILVDGRRYPPTDQRHLAAGSTIDVLPPFAGG